MLVAAGLKPARSKLVTEFVSSCESDGGEVVEIGAPLSETVGEGPDFPFLISNEPYVKRIIADGFQMLRVPHSS